jgi:hypothetical protein
MKRGIGMVLAVLVVATSAFADDGQLDCGEFSNNNKSYQYGQGAWLEYIVETRRPVNACPYAVEVQAYVVNVPGTAATKSDLFSASVRRQVPVPGWGRYQTNGKHTRILLGFRYDNGSTSSFADVQPPQEEDCSVYNGGGDYYVWDAREGHCVVFLGTPIIVDTERDGYRLTSAAEGVHFDVNADGVPELTAWTRRDSDDAFLAMDRNGNGRIDDGTELFGNRTPAYADREDVTTLNGFEALAFLQGPSYGRSTLDHQIDIADAAFVRLLLWRDANHNGLSEPEELTPLRAAGVRAIGTDYKENRRVDRFGNEFRQNGRIAWADGRENAVFDVWLQRGR